jgi:hypothetical protein
MEAAALAAKREYDLAITQAWHTAIFALNGYAGKLKGKTLANFLSGGERVRKQSNAAHAVAFFHRMKSAGMPVSISRVLRKPS